MDASLFWTAAVMGLLGGSHCLVMCAAPCAGLLGNVQPNGKNSAGEVILTRSSLRPMQRQSRSDSVSRIIAFHLGRGASYSAIGALAATLMQALAWGTQQASALRPFWTIAHMAVMAWGLWMLLLARQPGWAEAIGKRLWLRIRPLVQSTGGALTAGFLWGVMPCGLLYSALLVAALSGSAGKGALTMTFFAAGTSLWLLAGPWLWNTLRRRIDRMRSDWGTRLGGAMLCAAALWALWHDVVSCASLTCR